MEVIGQLYVRPTLPHVEGNHVIHCTGGWVGAGKRLYVPVEENIS